MYYFAPVAWQWDVRLPEHRGGVWESSHFSCHSSLGEKGIQSSRIFHLWRYQSLVYPYSRVYFFIHYCLHSWSRWLPAHPSEATLPNLQKHNYSPHLNMPLSAQSNPCWIMPAPWVHTHTPTPLLLNIKTLNLFWKCNLLFTQIIISPPPSPKMISICEHYLKCCLVPILKSCFLPSLSCWIPSVGSMQTEARHGKRGWLSLIQIPFI